MKENNSNPYINFISLGYFCSVAMELERYGFRNASYPFDWLITPRFDYVIDAIDTGFEGFLDYDALEQDTVKRQIYHNRNLHCSFVHDFNRFTPLSEQLPAVSDKFKRRIDRFYKDTSEPTLFVRYINDETMIPGDGGDNGSESESRTLSELQWIEHNYDHILSTIRHDNPDNDILWIANTGVTSDRIQIYNVEKDPDDNVARRPFEKNPELGQLFDSFDIPDREQNLQRYLDKEQRKKTISYRLRKKTQNALQSAFKHEYIHTKAIQNKK